MTDSPNLRPASQDEIAQALAFALRYDGRKRVYDADETMAHFTARRLVRHIEQSGLVLMKRPPAIPQTVREAPDRDTDAGRS